MTQEQDDKDSQAQWYVLQVQTPNEKKIKKTIEEQLPKSEAIGLIEKVLIPIEKVSEIKRGQQVIVEKKLWPGYLLARLVLTDESWAFLKNVPGVYGFLGGENPVPLTQDEVSHMLKDLEEKRQNIKQKHEFQVGDRVKIIEGVFVNFPGTITEISFEKGRVSVLVSIFGRDTQVDDLMFEQIEALTGDEE
ncbi:MAG: transcription termination/antitermination protein NusG [Chlamydiia bacterium]|nr:transcription termination/antitermination protein NusG [Chlamydiia bacterium]